MSCVKIDAGKALLLHGRQRSFIYTYTVKAHNILRVKNAFVKIVYCVTECTICTVVPHCINVAVRQATVGYDNIASAHRYTLYMSWSDACFVHVVEGNAFAPSGNRILVVEAGMELVRVARRLRTEWTGVRNPVRGDFPVSKHVHTGSVSHPTCTAIGVTVLPLG